jgi:hypothetical protein
MKPYTYTLIALTSHNIRAVNCVVNDWKRRTGFRAALERKNYRQQTNVAVTLLRFIREVIGWNLKQISSYLF